MHIQFPVLSASKEFTRIVRHNLSQPGDSFRIEVNKEGIRFASEGGLLMVACYFDKLKDWQQYYGSKRGRSGWRRGGGGKQRHEIKVKNPELPDWKERKSTEDEDNTIESVVIEMNQHVSQTNGDTKPSKKTRTS